MVCPSLFHLSIMCSFFLCSQVVVSNDASLLSSHELTARFELIVDGLHSKSSECTSALIDLGETFFDHLYRNRSFVISNTSNIPLVFVVCSSFLTLFFRKCHDLNFMDDFMDDFFSSNVNPINVRPLPSFCCRSLMRC